MRENLGYLIAVAALAIIAVVIVLDWQAARRRRRPFAQVEQTPEILEFNGRIARRRQAELAKPKHVTPRGAA